MPEAPTLSQAFVEAASTLREAGIATPELDARLLLCHAAGLSHEAFIARAREAFPHDAAARLDGAITRRLKREPVARITGTREFYGRPFALGPATLDPRPDTETLVEAALDLVTDKGWQDKPLELLDLGTGTGAILITLLAELPRARGLGTDRSPEALVIAAANARTHGVASRASFIAGDWLEAVAGRFHLILSNPPYLATREIAGAAEEVAGYDPQLALDGGPDGLAAYRRIAARAGEALAEDGRLLVEIGPAQAGAVADILKEAGLSPGEAGRVRRDLAGRPRVVAAGRDLGSWGGPEGKKGLGEPRCSG
jgi:release factor glutamine methyltransferase